MELGDDEQPRKVGREISWSAVIAGAALAFTLWKAVGAAYSNLDARIHELALVVNSNAESKQRYDAEHRGFAQRFEKIETTISGCREKLIALQSDARARPDPFTGSDGRELRKRIDALERSISGGMTP